MYNPIQEIIRSSDDALLPYRALCMEVLEQAITDYAGKSTHARAKRATKDIERYKAQQTALRYLFGSGDAPIPFETACMGAGLHPDRVRAMARKEYEKAQKARRKSYFLANGQDPDTFTLIIESNATRTAVPSTRRGRHLSGRAARRRQDHDALRVLPRESSLRGRKRAA